MGNLGLEVAAKYIRRKLKVYDGLELGSKSEGNRLENYRGFRHHLVSLITIFNKLVARKLS